MKEREARPFDGNSYGQSSFQGTSTEAMSGSSEQTDNPTILYDGLCNLCHGAVYFLIERDPLKNLRFAPLQSESGQRILSENELPKDFIESIVFVEKDGVHIHSSASLRACGYLRFPWPAIKVFLLVPRPLRDLIYKWIVNNRYRWFGKREECPVPDPKDSDRFL